MRRPPRLRWRGCWRNPKSSPSPSLPTPDLWKLLYNIRPDAVYNLAAQSHVRVSFDVPEYTADITALGALRLLEGLRETGVKARYYQASSSEMFGSTPPRQNEDTPFHPRSP